MKVREESIKFGASKKKKIINELEEIVQSVANLEQDLSDMHINDSRKQQISTELEAKKEQLESLIEYKANGNYQIEITMLEVTVGMLVTVNWDDEKVEADILALDDDVAAPSAKDSRENLSAGMEQELGDTKREKYIKPAAAPPKKNGSAPKRLVYPLLSGKDRENGGQHGDPYVQFLAEHHKWELQWKSARKAKRSKIIESSDKSQEAITLLRQQLAARTEECRDLRLRLENMEVVTTRLLGNQMEMKVHFGKRRMSTKTRSKSKKESEMTATKGKFDTVLAKMDDLLKAKAEQEVKLNSILQKLQNLEISQKKTADDVKDLKQSYGFLEEQITEVKSDIAEKASRMELTKLEKRIDGLENRSKRNNIVIWGLREDAEKEHNSLELFLAHNFFENHMGIKGIEVMRAHRTYFDECQRMRGCGHGKAAINSCLSS
ncbi:myosin heavy chain, clone 203-like [Montipora foliosa]|uniref:myosin heavy chain, clone 203-like n=1 Tax=Montipora foliosa TaxID=591990 RepID=UPI0035F13AAF